MPVRESAIQHKFKQTIRRNHPRWRIRTLNGLGYRDWPDVMVLAENGLSFYIEFKRPGEKPRPTQRIMIDDIEGLGHNVEVFDDPQKAYAWVLSLVTRNSG